MDEVRFPLKDDRVGVYIYDPKTSTRSLPSDDRVYSSIPMETTTQQDKDKKVSLRTIKLSLGKRQLSLRPKRQTRK